ncbi:hypothetical protein PENTCL1PPCAC_1169, partial [Pristionchus entomophagus]
FNMRMSGPYMGRPGQRAFAPAPTPLMMLQPRSQESQKTIMTPGTGARLAEEERAMAPITQQTSMMYNQRPAAPRPTAIYAGGQDPITSGQLVQADPQDQKQMLGERIYSQIGQVYGERPGVGKITGMLLQMDNAELIEMLQDAEFFRAKVDEAIHALVSSK